MQVLGESLTLILVANSAPILIRQVPIFNRFEYPLDCNAIFVDGRPLLGASKTWRGVITAILATMVCSAVLHVGWVPGLLVGFLAMFGDALSSFIKRRLAMAPSDMALGIDQIPESLFPAIYLHYHLQLGWLSVVTLVLSFFILELLLSRIMYRLHIRKRPY